MYILVLGVEVYKYNLAFMKLTVQWWEGQDPYKYMLVEVGR